MSASLIPVALLTTCLYNAWDCCGRERRHGVLPIHGDPNVQEGVMASLQQELDALKVDGLYRWLRQIEGPQGPWMQVDGRKTIVLASSDHLGLASTPRLKEAARRAIDRYGCSASAARLISGNHDPYPPLGEGPAGFQG